MSELPAYLQNMPSRNLAQTAIANVGAGTPPYLSIQGGRFTLIDAAGNSQPAQKMDDRGNIYVDVVLVDVNDHVSKVFFGRDRPYDPDNPTPPLCFSDNGLAPSSAAGQPQAPTCASCPNNVWGSKISQMGSAVKQCTDQQKVAVYAPDYSDGLFLLRIPPGSFANWRSYMAKFAGGNVEPDRVVTRISFAPNAVGTLLFHATGYIDERTAGAVATMVGARAADQMIGRLDQPRQGALPPPVQAEVPAAISIPAAVQYSAPSATHQAQMAPLFAATVPVATTPAPAATPQQLSAQQSAPRRRRTRAEMDAARAAQSPAPSATTEPARAPFRPDPPPAQSASQPQAAPFGIAIDAPPPPPGLDLDAIFK